MRVFGLIGFPLSHSFSEHYFEKKFASEGIPDAFYKLFPLTDLSLLPDLIRQQHGLTGLNVTIPYKAEILPLLHSLSDEAKSIGAVNCIRIERTGEESKLSGYNTDAYGFHQSLLTKLKTHHTSALVLGTGGASKAVCYILKQLGITFKLVSRNPQSTDSLSYNDLNKDIIASNTLIINTTPVGMFPHIDEAPEFPYSFLNNRHLLFDLIYNPAETAFLRKGKQAGADTLNGLQMLELQAEKSWEIWNENCQ